MQLLLDQPAPKHLDGLPSTWSIGVTVTTDQIATDMPDKSPDISRTVEFFDSRIYCRSVSF